MDEIILLGSGGHARSCIDVIEQEDRFRIAGLVEQDGSNADHNLGYPIVGVDDDLEILRKKYTYALVTVGHIKSPETRIKIYKILKTFEYQLPIVISPSAYISKHTEINEGTIIMHGAIVNAGAVIANNCIINSKALIEHDAIIGNHSHIATGAIVNGGVSVGSESFIGSGVVTKQYISIGNNCSVGAGVTLKSDVKSGQVIIN